MLMLVSQLPITGSTHKTANGRRPLVAASGVARSARAWRVPSGSRHVRPNLLPVPYYHVVFTLPVPAAEIVFQNKRAVYAILFCAVAQTLRDIAADPRHLGAEIGAIAVLHTWGQTLQVAACHATARGGWRAGQASTDWRKRMAGNHSGR